MLNNNTDEKNHYITNIHNAQRTFIQIQCAL
jgi:hypothetical protein